MINMNKCREAIFIVKADSLNRAHLLSDVAADAVLWFFADFVDIHRSRIWILYTMIKQKLSREKYGPKYGEDTRCKIIIY